MVTFSLAPEQLLALLLSAGLPALVALVTKRLASPGLKALTLLFLAAVAGFGSELYDALTAGTAFDAGAAALTWLGSFIVAVTAHYGALKPAGITGSQGVIARVVPIGLGRDDPGKHSVEAIRQRLKAEKAAA